MAKATKNDPLHEVNNQYRATTKSLRTIRTTSIVSSRLGGTVWVYHIRSQGSDILAAVEAGVEAPAQDNKHREEAAMLPRNGL